MKSLRCHFQIMISPWDPSSFGDSERVTTQLAPPKTMLDMLIMPKWYAGWPQKSSPTSTGGGRDHERGPGAP